MRLSIDRPDALAEVNDALPVDAREHRVVHQVVSLRHIIERGGTARIEVLRLDEEVERGLIIVLAQEDIGFLVESGDLLLLVGLGRHLQQAGVGDEAGQERHTLFVDRRHTRLLVGMRRVGYVRGDREAVFCLGWVGVDRHDHGPQPEDRDQHDDLQRGDGEDHVDGHGIGFWPDAFPGISHLRAKGRGWEGRHAGWRGNGRLQIWPLATA